jgi:hypothetical protein
LECDPAEHEVRIPMINTELNHLRLCSDQTAQQWAQWVRNQVDLFDEGRVAVCQDFMNSAVIKFNNISGSTEGGFEGTATTIQEDIVAMVSAVKRKHDPTPPGDKTKTRDQESNAKKPKLPPILKYFMWLHFRMGYILRSTVRIPSTGDSYKSLIIDSYRPLIIEGYPSYFYRT